MVLAARDDWTGSGVHGNMKTHSKLTRARQLVAAGLVASLAACGGGGYSTGPQGTNTGGNTGGNNGSTISVAGTSFDPSSLTIAVGGTVSWVFAGVTHNIHFSGTGAPANVPDTSNGTVTRTFNTAGVFTMTCSIHAGMTGTITVQ